MSYKIGIDVDGVLRDFCGTITDVIKKKYPEYIPENFNGIQSWFIDRDFDCTMDQLKQIYWYDDVDTIMGNGWPMYGQIKQMYDLFDWAENNGHTLVCVTSQRPHARQYTLKWLGNYGLNFETVYFRRGKDKWKVDVDYLIDDSPENYHFWKQGRGMEHGFILRDAPYNQDIDTKVRINNLEEIKNIIK